MDTTTVDGRAFLTGVRNAPVADGTLALWYIGGAGYIVRGGGVTLLVDPFLGPSNPPDWIRAIPPAFAPDELGALGPIDAVLLTHEHDDHADPVALAAIAAMPDVPVYGSAAAIEVAARAGVDSTRAIVAPNGASFQFGDVRVSVVRMHDPVAKDANGYVLEIGSLAVLLCGDSLYFDGFAEIGKQWTIEAICLTVGANPPGMTIYLDESGAARAARDAGAARLIVQHYDLWEALVIDPERVRTVAAWYAPEMNVIPARFRGRITVEPPVS